MVRWSRILLAGIVLLCGMSPMTLAAPQSSCLACHGDRARMTALGYPHFTVTAKEVARQSGMPAGCTDCHRGDSQADSKEAAHAGLARLILVRKKGLVAETADRTQPLETEGNPMLRLRHRIEKDGRPVVDPTVAQLLYQDKRLDTLSQDFSIMEKTCGVCHPRELAEFRKSPMGRNAKQSSYRSWRDSERGPHNCGAWFDGNYGAIAGNTAVPFTVETAALNQRSCNSCHVGCLDCHYDPQAPDPARPRQGMHEFTRLPRPESCYGGGRGQICHAGPEERRRGAGYFGGAYANPEGMAPDVHLANQVGCLDCHSIRTNDRKLGHGTIKRQARCDGCHRKIVQGHARSSHRNLACEACHIREVAGYQGTYWGAGQLAGVATPYFKYKEYYGIMPEPILIRDQRGRWIPVKPFPMAVLNQKEGPPLAPGLYWRWPRSLPDLQRTDDAWGYVGMRDDLPESNRALLWIQLDKLSHKYGRSRSCISCHGGADGEQRQEVSWEFSDAGALPFAGRHTIVAGRDGLAIRGISAIDRIEPTAGVSLASFAPWFYFPDAWRIPGDFTLPPLKDRHRYESGRDNPAKARQLSIIHR